MKRKIIFLCSISSFLLLLVLLVMPGHSLATPEPSPIPSVEPIIMWSGKVADIPNGWQLCDGTNNTPDLRDRFIQGVDTGELPGQTSGSHEVTLTVDNLSKHKHKFTTDPAGAHDHGFDDAYYEEKKFLEIDGWSTTHLSISKTYEHRITEPWGQHAHNGITDSQGKSTPFDNRPKYYRLAFITKKYQAPRSDRFNPHFLAPQGGIVMWSGDPNMLPVGWRLCDGSNSAPDLRDRFVLGVQTGQDPGEMGGSDSIQLSIDNLPKHKHDFDTKAQGNHTHTYKDYWLNDTISDDVGGIFPKYLVWPNNHVELRITSDSGAHNHGGATEDVGDGDPLENRPSFLRLAVIISKGENIKPVQIPKGAITMWSEDQTTIPSCWCFCDGASGTPDLRCRFVQGGETPGGTGGSITNTLSIMHMPKHKHMFTTTTNGKHSHKLADYFREKALFWANTYHLIAPSTNGSMKSLYHMTYPTNDHTHSGTTDEAGKTTPLAFDNRPAYYKLAFIMRIE